MINQSCEIEIQKYHLQYQRSIAVQQFFLLLTSRDFDGQLICVLYFQSVWKSV